MSTEIILVLALVAETLMYSYILFRNIEQEKYIKKLEEELGFNEHKGKTSKNVNKKAIWVG